MHYWTCPHCGNNLDYGEKCDCGGKERGAALHHQELPRNKTSTVSLSVPCSDVKSFDLRALRLESGASGKEMVKVVQMIYPKYDKTIQSKCERGNEYGIQLRSDAAAALIARFAPGCEFSPEEPVPVQKRATRHGMHRLKNSIRCRLPSDIYVELLARIKEDGGTIQAWMTHQVQKYLAEKRVEKRSSTT